MPKRMKNNNIFVSIIVVVIVLNMKSIQCFFMLYPRSRHVGITTKVSIESKSTTRRSKSNNNNNSVGGGIITSRSCSAVTTATSCSMIRRRRRRIIGYHDEKQQQQQQQIQQRYHNNNHYVRLFHSLSHDDENSSINHNNQHQEQPPVVVTPSLPSSSLSTGLYLPSLSLLLSSQQQQQEKPIMIRTVVAPMVAMSDYPFRCLCRQVNDPFYNMNKNQDQNHHHHQKSGCGRTGTQETIVPVLTFTQMLHARNIVRLRNFRENHFDFYENHEYHHNHDEMMDYNDDDRSTSTSTNRDNNNNNIQKHLRTTHRRRRYRPVPYSSMLPSQRLILSRTGSDIDLEQQQPQQQQQHNPSSLDDTDYSSNKKEEWILPSDWVPYTSGPLIVQLAGDDPDLVVQAAQIILQQYPNIQGFDLNCGCPQAIARKGNYGAFLLEYDKDRVYQILKALRCALPNHISVSVKIRLPLQSKDLVEQITQLIDTGVNFITIHGRTMKENKAAVQHCHMNEIQRAIQIAQDYYDTLSNQKENINNNNYHQQRFPIIANGGVETFPDIDKILNRTGAVAVMSSEALLETPNVLSFDSTTLSPNELFHQQIQFCHDYITWCSYTPPLPGVLAYSMNIVRGHLLKFLYRYVQHCPEAHVYREELVTSHRLRTLQDVENYMKRFYEFVINNPEIIEIGAHPNSSWYRRHRDDRKSSTSNSTSTSSTTTESGSQIERKLNIQSRIDQLRKMRIERDNKQTIVQ